MRPDRSGCLHLQLMGRGRAEEPCGVHAAPPHLPVDLWRLPGETVEQLAHRAAQSAVGQGSVVAFLMYPGQVRY